MAVKKPDWIASRLTNTTSPEAVLQSGANFGEYEVQAPEVYWDKPKVQEMFEGSKDAFNNFYKQEVQSLEGFKKFQKDVKSSPVYQARRDDALFQRTTRPDSNILSYAPYSTEVKPDFEGRSYGWLQPDLWSKPTKSWKEVAYTNGVLKKDNSFVKFDDFDGMATWAMQKDGSLKLDEKGLPYMEEIDQTQTLTEPQEIVNPIANYFGLYGLDFGPTQFLGTILNAPHRMVNEVVQPLLSIPKVFTDEGSQTDQIINYIANGIKSTDWGTTQEAVEDRYGFESLFDATIGVAGQLLGAKGVGTLTQGALKKMGASAMTAAKGASLASKSYFTSIAAGAIGRRAMDHGISKTDAGIMMALSVPIFWKIMGLSEYAIGASKARDLAGISRSLESIIDTSISKGSNNLLKGAFRYRLGNLLSSATRGVEAIPYLGVAATRGGAEAIEEGVEQWVENGFLTSFDYLNSRGMTFTNNPAKNFFGNNFEDWDWEKEWENTQFAMTAGAIGGGIVGNAMQKFRRTAPPVYDHFVKVAIDGGSELSGFLNYVESQEKAGVITPNQKDMIFQTMQSINDTVKQYNLDKAFNIYNEDLKQVYEVDIPKFLDNKSPSNVAGYTSITRDMHDVILEMDQLKQGEEPLSESEQSRLETLENKLASFKTGENKAKYQEQLALHMVHSALYRNADKLNRSGVLKGEKPLNAIELWQLNDLVKSGYQNEQSKRNKQREELLEESETATRENIGQVRITEAKQEELTREISKDIIDSVDKLNQLQDAQGLGDSIRAELQGIFGTTDPYRILEANPNQIEQYLNQVASNPEITSEEQTLATALNDLNKLKDIQPTMVEDLDQENMFFQAITRKDGKLKPIPGEELGGINDIRNMVKRLESTEQQSRTGDRTTPLDNYIPLDQQLSEEEQTQRLQKLLSVAAYEPDQNAIEFLERNINARQDQLETNQMAKAMFADKLPNSQSIIYNDVEMAKIANQLSNLKARIQRLKLVGDLTKGNPEAIRAKTAMRHMNKVNSKIFDERLMEVTNWTTVLDNMDRTGAIGSNPVDGANSMINALDEAAQSGNVDEYLDLLSKFEDGIYEAFQNETLSFEEFQNTLDPRTDREAILLSYIAGLKALPSSQIYQAYNTFIPQLNKTLSIGQFLAMQDVVRMAWSTDELEATKNNSYSAILDAAGGAGKTAAILPMAASVLNELSSRIYNSQGKVLLMAAPGYPDKLSNLSSEVNESWPDASQFVKSGDEILEFLNRPVTQTLDYNVIVLDEAGLLKADTVTQIFARLNELNNQRANTAAPLRIVFSGDTLQIKTFNSKGAVDFNLLDTGQEKRFFVKKTDRLDFSFRSTNQDLAIIEKAFTSLYQDLNTTLPSTVYDRESHEGVEIVKFGEVNETPSNFLAKAKAFLEDAMDKGESIAIITDKGLHPDLAEYQHLVVDPVSSQGNKWDKVVFIPSIHNIRATTDSESHARRVYYTAMTRPVKGLLALVPNTIQGLDSKSGKVFSYSPSEVSTSIEQEQSRVETILNQSTPKQVAPVRTSKVPQREIVSTEAQTAAEIENTLSEVNQKAAQEPVQTPAQTTELETKVSSFLDNLVSQNPTSDLYTGLMVGESLANINLMKDFLYNPKAREKMDLSLVLGRIDQNRFKLIKGQANYDSWRQRGKELRLFLQVNDGERQTIVGALPYAYKDGEQTVTLDDILPNLRVPPTGITIDIDHSDVVIASKAKNFEKASRERSSRGSYTIPELAQQFKGMVISDVMIATQDYTHKASTGEAGSSTIRSGQAFVATSFKHRSPAQLNTLFEENRQAAEEEFITYWPLSSGDGIRFTSKEVEETLEAAIGENFSLDFDTLIGSDLWKADQVNKLNQVLWHNRVNKSNLAVEGKDHLRSVFETKEEALQVPLIGALNQIYQGALSNQERAELIQHLPSVVLESNDQPSDPDAHDKRAFENRRTLALNALRTRLISDELTRNGQVMRILSSIRGIGKKQLSAKQKEVLENLVGPGVELNRKDQYVRLARVYLAAAEGSQLNIYEKVRNIMDAQHNEQAYIQPDFALGEGMGRSPFTKATVTRLPGGVQTEDASDALYNRENYNNTNLSWARINLKNGIEYPHVKLAWGPNFLNTKLQSYVQESIPIATDSTPLTEIEEIEGEDERTITQTFDKGNNLKAFVDTYYPGEAGNFVGEGLNYFRRKVTTALYDLSADSPKVFSVDQAIRQLQAELSDAQSFDNLQDKRSLSTNPKIRAKYHEWVMGQAFDFMLRYAYPGVKYDNRGKVYRNYVTYRHHSGVNSKEESALGENMTQMVKSMLYSTPILEQNLDGTFKTILKDGVNEPNIGTEYLNEATVPNMIEKLQHLNLYHSPDPSKSSRENFIDLLREGATTSPHIDSFYRRFFAPEPYIVNGKKLVSFSQIDNPVTLDLLNGLESYMSSNNNMSYYTVDITKDANPLPTSEGGVGDLTYNTFLTMAHLHKTGGVKVVDTFNQTYNIEGRRFTLGDTPEIANKDEILAAYKAIGIEISDAMFERLKNKASVEKRVKRNETEEQAEERVNNVAELNTVTELHRGLVKSILPSITNGNLRQRKIGILEKLSEADHLVNGTPLRNFVRNVKGEKQYVLTKGFPLTKLQRAFHTTRPTDLLSDNLFNTDSGWQIDSLLLKLGIKGENPDKAASLSDMQPDEHFEHDFINGFLEPLQKSNVKNRKRLAAIPFTVYADSRTAAIPVVRIPYDPASKNYNQQINDDYIKSRRNYLFNLERNIRSRWNEILPEPASNIDELTKAIAQYKGSVDSLIPNLDYISNPDGGYKLKNRLVADIKAAQRGITPKMLQDEAKTETKRYRKWLDQNPEMKQRAEKAAETAGMSLNEALYRFYNTWRLVSYNLSNVALGPEYQYKGKDGDLTAEVKDKIKRAKALVSPYQQRLYRSPNWSNGIEKTPDSPLTITLGDQIKVNGQTLSPRIMDEGTKLGPIRNVAIVSDFEMNHNLVSGEQFSKETLDGATFILPLMNYYLTPSNGGTHGVPTTNTSKPVTYSMNNGVKTYIKNAQFTLTPTVLKNATPEIVNMTKAMLDQPLVNQVKRSGEVYNTALEILYGLGVDENLSNLENKHFTQLAEILVVTENQDSIIHELVPQSSVKTGGRFLNPYGSAKLVPYPIDQTLGGIQLNATKDDTKLPTTKYSSQALSSITLNQPKQTVETLRNHLAQLTELTISDWNEKTEADLKASFVNGITSSAESNTLISFQQRLKLADPGDYSLSDQAVMRFYMSVQSSQAYGEGISPKYKGWDYIIHPADGVVEIYRHKKSGKIKLKSEMGEAAMKSGNWEISSLRYGEPTVLDENKKRIPITEVPEFNQLTDRKSREAWISSREDLEYGETEIMVPRKQFLGGFRDILDNDVQPNQVTLEYIGNRILANKLKKEDIDYELAQRVLRPEEDEGKVKIDDQLQSQILRLKEEAYNEAEDRFSTWQSQLQGVLNRTPGTGKHSTTAAKVIHFIDGSDNSIFVPSKLLTVKGADQDIDKESFVNYKIIKGKRPLASDITPEMLSNRSKKDLEFIKAALQNSVVYESLKILTDPKNAFESHQSVEGILNRMKELAGTVKQTPRRHSSYADMVEMQTENNQGKSLISVFANIQKIYLTMKEVKTLTGDNMGFSELNRSKDQVSITLAGLINAATDAVKEGILANLGIDTNNGPLVSYWVMQGVSLEDIVKKRLQDPDLVKYFDNVRASRRFDSETSVSQIPKPKTWASDITQANAITNLASILPNTADSAPSSMEDYVRFHKRFKDIMSDLGVENFDIYEFLNATDVERFEDISKIEEGINPLKLVQNVPHMKKYFELINAVHNKHYDLIPAYKYVYESSLANPRSKHDAIMYRTWQGFAERFFSRKNIHSATLSDSDGNALDLSNSEGRANFIQRMHSTFYPNLKSTYPATQNKFVKELSLVEFNSTAASTDEIISEDMIQITDLRSLSDQRIAEVKAGFDGLTKAEQTDLFYYSLMVNGLREGGNSFAALIDHNLRSEWIDFLNTLDRVFEDYINPGELVENVRNAVRRLERVRPSKLGLPFDLTQMNPAEGGTQYISWLNRTKSISRSNGIVKRRTEKQPAGTTMNEGLFRSKVVGGIIEARDQSEKARTKLKQVVFDYLKAASQPRLLEDSNISRINELIDSTNQSDEAKIIESTELTSRLAFGRSPADMTSLDITNLGSMKLDLDKIQDQEAIAPVYRAALSRLQEIAQQDDKRASWKDVQEQLKKCS